MTGWRIDLCSKCGGKGWIPKKEPRMAWLTSRATQIIVKAAGYIGLPLTTAEAAQVVSTLAGAALFALDLWIHRRREKTK